MSSEQAPATNTDDESSDKQLLKNSTDAYKVAVRMNEACIKKNWQLYATLIATSDMIEM